MRDNTLRALSRFLRRTSAALALGAAVTAQAALTTVSYAGPGVPIPDNTPAGINVVLPVAGVTENVTGVSFRFDALAGCNATMGDMNAALDHSFLGDLEFKLTSPAGTTVSFIQRRGGTTENVCNTLITHDGVSTPVGAWINATGFFIFGTYQSEPTGSLASFYGQNPNGNWTLNVSDNRALDTGTLRRFSLLISSGPTPMATPVPTLGEYGMMVLTMLVMAFGLGVIQRRQS